MPLPTMLRKAKTRVFGAVNDAIFEVGKNSCSRSCGVGDSRYTTAEVKPSDRRVISVVGVAEPCRRRRECECQRSREWVETFGVDGLARRCRDIFFDSGDL